MTHYLRLLFFIPLLFVSISNFAYSTPICGDADGDGVITILDALTAAQLSVGNPGYLTPSYCLADIDNSGTFTIIDSLRIAQQAIGYQGSFQCQQECLDCLVSCPGRCSSTQDCMFGYLLSSSSPITSTQYLEIFDFIIDTQGRTYILGKFWGNLLVNGQIVQSAPSLSAFIARLDANYNHEWSRSFPITGTIVALYKPSSLAFDSSGNLISAISLLGTINIDGTSYYLSRRSTLLAKFNKDSGQTVWRVPLDGWGEPAFALDQQGNIFLGATFNSAAQVGSGWIYSTGFNDLLVAKLDTNGNLITWNQYGGSRSEDNITALAVDNSTNSVVISGGIVTHTAASGFSFGGDTLGLWSQNFIVKFNNNLTHEWTLPLQTNFHPTQIQFDQESKIISAGWFQNDFTLGGRHIVPIPDRINGFVAKFNYTGSPVWILPILTNSFGGVYETNDFKRLQIDDDGNIILTGEFFGYINIDGFIAQTLAPDRDKFITKIDKRGFYLWANTISTPQQDSDYGVAMRGNNATSLTFDAYSQYVFEKYSF